MFNKPFALFLGSIPAELGSLTSLRYLYLNNNRLTGKLSFLRISNYPGGALIAAVF